MTVEHVPVESLFPSARALFRGQQRLSIQGRQPLRWLASLVAVGGFLVVGRWALGWLDRNV